MSLPASTQDTLPPVHGPALREARRALGLTQPQLATVAGLTQQWISRIERGAKPQPHIAHRLRQALSTGCILKEAGRGLPKKKQKLGVVISLRISQPLHEALTLRSLVQGKKFQDLVRETLEMEFLDPQPPERDWNPYASPPPPIAPGPTAESLRRRARRKKQEEEEREAMDEALWQAQQEE